MRRISFVKEIVPFYSDVVKLFISLSDFLRLYLPPNSAIHFAHSLVTHNSQFSRFTTVTRGLMILCWGVCVCVCGGGLLPFMWQKQQTAVADVSNSGVKFRLSFVSEVSEENRRCFHPRPRMGFVRLFKYSLRTCKCEHAVILALNCILCTFRYQNL